MTSELHDIYEIIGQRPIKNSVSYLAPLKTVKSQPYKPADLTINIYLTDYSKSPKPAAIALTTQLTRNALRHGGFTFLGIGF